MGAGALNGNRAAARRGRFGSAIDWLPVAVFAALPVIGLVAGPSYSGLVFGLGIVEFLYATAARRLSPEFDVPLLSLAGGFALLCWASSFWSIAPRMSEQGALQITAIFAASLIVLSYPLASARVADSLFRATSFAFLLGAILIGADATTGYRLEAWLSPGAADIATKYNRGADYLVLLAWPLLARAAARREWQALALLGLSSAIVLGFGLSATGRVAAMAGIAVLAAAYLSPRSVARALSAITSVLALAAPLIFHLLAEHRATVAGYLLRTPHLKMSGLARLEIWDYMTARVFERPLLGWGMWSAKYLPVGAGEAAGIGGNYPHNQWLQLWVETGATGAVLGLAFALLVLARARRRLAAEIRPFAYAAFASALTISLANFDVATDSWWAALAASGFLFMALAGRPAGQG